MQTGLKALERRLVNNELSEDDKRTQAEVRQVVALRREGATILECARKIGKSERALQQFMKRGVYKLHCDYLAKLERGEDEKQIRDVVKTAKEAFAQFAPDAIDFYKECFERNPIEEQSEKGIFKDPARAEWATERVSKGLGLTEPDISTRPTISIASAVIVGELRVMAADDARAEEAITVEAQVVED